MSGNGSKDSRDDELARRRRRALYRACHRGTKEMDLLLGRYADAAVPAMGRARLENFEALLALPDPDIEDWVKGAGDPGPDGAFGDLVRALRAFHGLD